MRGLLALTFAISAGCTPLVAAPTPTSSPPAEASVIVPTSSPSVSVAPRSGLSPTPRAALQGLQTSALGALRGDWVFAVRETYVPEGVRVRVDVLAMPLAEQEQAAQGPRVLASYLKAAGGVTLPPGEVLPRQFSPDGRRLALNTPAGIVVVELETGSASLLAEGQDPVWGSGERIAFIRGDPSAPMPTTTTWIVAASGGAPREHPCGIAFAWTYDGSACIRPAAGGFILDFPDQPTSSGFGWSVALDPPGRGGMPLSVRPAAGVTVLAVASTDLPAGGAVLVPTPPDPSYEHRIEVLSTPGGGSRTVVASERGRFIEVRFAEPRWNPRADQILYRIEGSRRLETHVVDANTKQDVVARITGVVRAAEWTPNGEQIVYLTDVGSAIGPATEVRAVRPISGRDDRVLLSGGGDARATFTSIAARRYD